MTPERLAVLQDLEPVVERLLTFVRPVEACWQPSDLLPKMDGEGWREDVEALRSEAARLSDELLVVLVGNIVTEEALPSYQTALNRFGGLTDRTGTDAHAWARWTRAWTAEENRHGDVTRAYLYLAGRVDLPSVERTVQHLLRNGFDSRADEDPYRGIAYAAFQEHATKVSWNQVGSLARGLGAPQLHRICGLIAADEARHERIYVTLLREILKRDPDDALLALHETLSRAVTMPARTMTDGHDRDLFAHFAAVGQRIGVYTLEDYATNMAQLIQTLGIQDLTAINGEAGRARDAMCALPGRLSVLADQHARRPARKIAFSWLHGRRV